MNALPPLPDHRAVVLLALAELGASPVGVGVVSHAAAHQAAIGRASAWLALAQLRHQGFVNAIDDATDPYAPRTYRLTDAGVALLPHLKGETA